MLEPVTRTPCGGPSSIELGTASGNQGMPDAREHRPAPGRLKLRPGPRSGSGAKRGHADGGVDFSDRGDDAKQRTAARAQFAHREVQRVGVEQEQQVQVLPERRDHVVRPRRIAPNPARDRGQPCEPWQFARKRARDRLRQARIAKDASDGHQRTDLPEWANHRTHAPRRPGPDEQVDCRARDGNEDRAGPERDRDQGAKDDHGPDREHDVPAWPGERVFLRQPPEVIALRIAKRRQGQLDALARRGVGRHPFDQLLEPVQVAGILAAAVDGREPAAQSCFRCDRSPERPRPDPGRLQCDRQGNGRRHWQGRSSGGTRQSRPSCRGRVPGLPQLARIVARSCCRLPAREPLCRDHQHDESSDRGERLAASRGV